MEGSLVIIRAYWTYTLVGPPALRLAYDPLAVYSSRTDYIYNEMKWNEMKW